VIDHLQSLVRRQKDWALSFVYCRAKDRLSVSQILCSLLRQLVEDHEHVFHFLYEHHFLSHIRDRTTPSDNHLVSALNEALLLFSHVFIVIDAVDELPPRTQNELLNILNSLNASILVTSTPLPSLNRLLPNAATIEISPSQQDFTYFVDNEIEKIPPLRALFANRLDLRGEVITRIRDTSGNM
jgi:hypothetical protein